MQMIAAVDKNWGIGRKGKLLVSIPQDMKLFRNETMGHVIVMGRKTLESFPGKKPLPGRTNIVLTRDTSYEVKGALVVHSEEETGDALDAAMGRDDVGIILMTPKALQKCEELVRRYKLERATPLIIEIPDRHGNSNVTESISRYLKEAVGV